MQYIKYMDIDGLNMNTDAVRLRMNDMMSRYESEIAELKQKLAVLQSRPPHSPGPCCQNRLLIPPEVLPQSYTYNMCVREKADTSHSCTYIFTVFIGV